MKQTEPVEVSHQLRGAATASLFGRFPLFAPDGSEVIISNRRARALIAMLCLDWHRPVVRVNQILSVSLAF